MRARVPCQTSALSLIGLLWENNRSMRLSYGMSIGEWGNGWEKRCAWFPWRERPEKGGVNSLLILVPVFFRNVVFRDFVGLDFHFVRVVRVLYTFDDVSLVGISFFQQFFHAFRGSVFPSRESLQISRLSAGACAQASWFERNSVYHRGLAADAWLLFSSFLGRRLTKSSCHF